jgi:hypothetical protein
MRGKIFGWSRRATVVLIASAIVIGSILFASLKGRQSQGEELSVTTRASNPQSIGHETPKIAGKPIIRLAADDWTFDGRGHNSFSIWDGGENGSSTFEVIPHDTKAKIVEGRYIAHDKVEIPG